MGTDTRNQDFASVIRICLHFGTEGARMRDRGDKDCQNAPRFLAVRGFQDATIWCPCSAHKILWKTSNLCCSSLGVSHFAWHFSTDEVTNTAITWPSRARFETDCIVRQYCSPANIVRKNRQMQNITKQFSSRAISNNVGWMRYLQTTKITLNSLLIPNTRYSTLTGQIQRYVSPLSSDFYPL